jgi:NAD(P)-dependent dehydrogenase (short-subunit alcohol dehydrogenase family)
MQPTVHEQFDLSGKVALITGATGHLGRAMATGLAEAGAAVVVTSRSEGKASALAEELPKARGVKHFGIGLDHLDENSIRRGFAAAVEQAGKLDILVNNGHNATTQTWHDATAGDFEKQLANVTGYFLLARHLRDHLVQRNAPGSIIMLGSMYGVVSSNPAVYEGIGPGNPVAYQVLKGGVAQLARHLAVHWAVDRIRVNTLSPGPFPNGEKLPPGLRERLVERTPLQRLGQPQELMGAVVFLASEASSFVTGHNLMVDGGWTAW